MPHFVVNSGKPRTAHHLSHKELLSVNRCQAAMVFLANSGTRVPTPKNCRGAHQLHTPRRMGPAHTWRWGCRRVERTRP
jgi:hypothetical protein